LVLTNGDPDDAVDHLTWHQDQISSFAGTKIAPQRHRPPRNRRGECALL